MTITIEIADKDHAQTIISVAKACKAEHITIAKEPSKRLKKAIKQVEKGKLEGYKDFEEFRNALIEGNLK